METSNRELLDQLSKEELIQLILRERTESSHNLTHTTSELNFLRQAIQVLNSVAQSNWKNPLTEKIFHIDFRDEHFEKIIMEEYNKLKEE